MWKNETGRWQRKQWRRREIDEERYGWKEKGEEMEEKIEE